MLDVCSGRTSLEDSTVPPSSGFAEEGNPTGRAPDKRRESVTKSLVSLGKSAEKKLSREEMGRKEGPETKLEESSRARIGRRINAGLRDMSASSRNLAYELVRVQPMCGGHVVVAAGSLRLRLSLLLLLLRPQ